MKHAIVWSALAILGLCVAVPALRAADEIDQNDPSVRKEAKSGSRKLTPQELMRIRIAELEGGAIAESLKTPETATLVGPPLTDREKVVHVFNRLAFGPRPGDVDRVAKESSWDKWVKTQLEPDKIDDSKLDALLAKKYPFLKKPIAELAGEMNMMEDEARKKQAQMRRDFRESVLFRAVYSNRQFKEVMCEFWRNHFCVDMPDNDETDRSFTAPDYEEKVIRAHVMGNFKQMLFASATHPCMLEYLDNFKSRANNWNENYAREVMELHTLGADRFYNENDVLELSKVLTGWTFNDKYVFEFRSNWHQPGNKTVLGSQIPHGYNGGELALYGLATHRGTADFIAFKLCRYLVNDNPPQSLVSKVASTFKSSNGDLPKTYAVILNSPEFLQRGNYRAKFKTPFEFTASALRVTDATIEDGKYTVDTLHKMGQPIYLSKDPTGYYDQAEAWRDAGVLTSRWDYSWKLVRGSANGVKPSPEFTKAFAGLKDKELIDKMIDTLIGSDIGSRTLDVMRKAAETGKQEEMISVLLGSPSFQQQ